MNWTFRGKCWRFGDNLGIDGAIMPLRFALSRETDPMILRDFLMSEIDPDFSKKVRPGDIIVGGRRFGQGNPHIQGFLGIKGHGLGLVAESIPRGSFRNVINAGVPFLAPCPDVTSTCETGDDLERHQAGINQHRHQRIAPLGLRAGRRQLYLPGSRGGRHHRGL